MCGFYLLHNCNNNLWNLVLVVMLGTTFNEKQYKGENLWTDVYKKLSVNDWALRGGWVTVDPPCPDTACTYTGSQLFLRKSKTGNLKMRKFITVWGFLNTVFMSQITAILQYFSFHNIQYITKAPYNTIALFDYLSYFSNQWYYFLVRTRYFLLKVSVLILQEKNHIFPPTLPLIMC